jgi:hypothetical protein
VVQQRRHRLDGPGVPGRHAVIIRSLAEYYLAATKSFDRD